MLKYALKLCVLPTANCRLLLIAYLLLPIALFSQKDIDYPSDLDAAKVDSFYSKLNIDLHDCKTPELYFEVYRWYRTCYRYGGSNTKGIDCSHFINMLYEKLYDKKLESSAAAIYTQCRPLKGMHKAKEGDLLFFKIHHKRISHIGIYLQDGKFAHASTQLGVTISSMDEPYYKKRFYKVGRVR